VKGVAVLLVMAMCAGVGEMFNCSAVLLASTLRLKVGKGSSDECGSGECGTAAQWWLCNSGGCGLKQRLGRVAHGQARSSSDAYHGL
jgi:hypothetical protein